MRTGDRDDIDATEPARGSAASTPPSAPEAGPHPASDSDDFGAQAAQAATAAVVGAIKGAKGGVGGAAIGAVRELARSKQGRKLLAGAVVAALLPAYMLAAMLMTMGQAHIGASANEHAAAEAAMLSEIPPGAVTAHAYAADGSKVPWYMLTAIDHAEPGDQDTNPYGIETDDPDVPTDADEGGEWLAGQLQAKVSQLAPDFGPTDWNLMAGGAVTVDDDGNHQAGVPDDDPERREQHEHAMGVWTQAVAAMPIRDADARARGIVQDAFKLATGSTINGCGVNAGSNPSGRTVAAGVWVNPAQGRVSSKFGMRTHPVTGVRKLHTGSDIANAKGTPIHAAASGIVTATGGLPACSDRACGAVIQIDHGNGVQTRYLHMSYDDHRVSLGDEVNAGQVIGLMNTEGYSTGPHLHFEVLVNGSFIDPVPFLADRGAVFATGPVGAESQVAAPAVPSSPPPGAPPPAAGPGSEDTAAGDPLSVINADPSVKHVPYTEEAATQAGITTDLRLKKLNGASVIVTKEAQYNAAVVVNTIRQANWPGVSAADKDRLALIALITMAQESTFYTNAASKNPDENQDAGPFQQRTKVGWYADGATQAENVEILQSIPYATLTFIEGHKVAVDAAGGAGPVGYRIPGVFSKKEWRTQEPWRTSVAVQVPAKWTYPMSEAWTPVAQALLAAIDGTVVSVDGGSNLAGCWGGGNAQFTTGTLSLVEPGPWGGHEHGSIPASELCSARVADRTAQLRCDAAKALEVLAEEYKRFGNGAGELRLADGVNGYQSRMDLSQSGGGAHDAFGWGLAVRLDPGSPAFAWVVEHQDTLSWKQPANTRATDPGLFLYYAVAGPQADGWEVGLKPATVNIGRYVLANYEDITTIGGHRRDTTNDHPSGRAIDIMIPDYGSTAGKTLGDRMAADLRARANELGIQYIIWDQHIWNVARDGEGWRHMKDRGSDSANHFDHLHVNTW